MTLILQIVLGLAILVGLVTIIMSKQNWHWSQLVIVLFIFFSAIGVLFLGAETLRIHHNLRAGIPKLEDRIARLEQEIEVFLKGTNDKPGILELEHRLLITTRERGRVWRDVTPAGQVSPTGQVSVEIANPQPHGLEQDAILYAFEAGEPNAADPSAGAQYLGEFRVSAVQEGGVTLEPVLLLIPGSRDGQRLANSQGPWSLYETMPIDRHSIFADLSEEELRSMLPAETVEEYLRHGKEADAGDDERHVVGLDEDGNRVGPEDTDKVVVKRLYDRDLRDYAFLFGEFASAKVIAAAKILAVAQDNAKMTTALASAEQMSAFRQQQIENFNSDLEGMKRDRATIEAHRDAVSSQRDHFLTRASEYQQANSELARKFTERQLGLVNYINSVAPAPSR